MKYREVQKSEFVSPTATEYTVRQWISAAGRWIVQCDLMMFGVRCNVCEVADPHGICRPYCMGQNRLAILLVPRVVMIAMEQLPEEATAADVGRLLPMQTRKPMHNDRHCWDMLCRQAGVELPSLESGRDDAIPVLADAVFNRKGH